LDQIQAMIKGKRMDAPVVDFQSKSNYKLNRKQPEIMATAKRSKKERDI